MRAFIHTLVCGLLYLGAAVTMAQNDKTWQYRGHTITEADVAEPATMLQEMLLRVKGGRIDPSSRDFAILRYIEEHHDLAGKVIPQLIDLAFVLEPRRIATAEPVDHKFQMSPAGKALVAAGEAAVVPIGRWLQLHFDDASNHREVLLEVMRRLKEKRRSLEKSKDSASRQPPPATVTTQRNVALPVMPHQHSEEKVTANPALESNGGFRASSFLPGALLGLITGVLVGFWIGRRLGARSYPMRQDKS